MSERKIFELSLVTWPKFFVYILPLLWVALLPPVGYMVPVLASIAWGIRKSRTTFEKVCGCIMVPTWLIWGRHTGLSIAYEERGGWQVLLIAVVLYLLVEESDYRNRTR